MMIPAAPNPSYFMTFCPISTTSLPSSTSTSNYVGTTTTTGSTVPVSTNFGGAVAVSVIVAVVFAGLVAHDLVKRYLMGKKGIF